MQFTLEQEENNALHFLDLTISRTDNNVQSSTYRKPTTTNAILPSDSYHPSEHKLSAIRYLHNTNATYMTTPEEKQNETTIIKHILQANKCNTSFDTNNKQQNRKDNPDPTNKKWTKFTYIGKDTRVITKLFKHTNIRIAFTIRNNLGKLLTSLRDDQHTDIYSRNGVYQLTCNTCHKQYIGRLASFRTRFKEHEQDYRHNSGKSLYGKHLVDYNHPLQSIDSSMHILRTAENGRLLNVIEKFYFHTETTANNQLNDRMTAEYNILFDVILRHTQPLEVIRNTT
jgi:hypothetical protein